MANSLAQAGECVNARISTVEFALSIESIRKTVSGWAFLLPEVKRVWLFGSRAKRTERECSDVDLAVELDTDCLDGDDPITYWVCSSEEMLSALQPLIPCVIDFQLYSDRIPSFVAQRSVVLYEKAVA